MKALAGFVLAMSLLGGAVHAGEALPTGRAEAAKPLIAEQCIKCHVVPGFPADKVQPAAKAPSFSEIAASPARYPDSQIAAFLRQPHYPMKGFVLSKKDIANIIAFIRTLREEH